MYGNALIYVLALVGLVHIFNVATKTKSTEQTLPPVIEKTEPQDMKQRKIDFNTPIYKTKDVT